MSPMSTMPHPARMPREPHREAAEAGRHVPHVGDVRFASAVCLQADDLWAEALDLPRPRGTFDPARVARARRRRAGARVVARAAADVAAALGLPGAGVRHVSNVRLLEPPACGEPLRPLATVRYRSMKDDGSCHITMCVELRRPGGRLLGTFEVGVHVPAPCPIRRSEHTSTPQAA